MSKTTASSTTNIKWPKITRAIQETLSQQRNHDPFLVVLILSGALNPVHKGHTAILHAARTALEGQEHDGRPIKVVGLVLSPSSDNYVGGKLKGDAMSLVHRNAMCALASADDRQMSVLTAGQASGTFCAELVYHEVLQDWAAMNEKEGQDNSTTTKGSFLSKVASAVTAPFSALSSPFSHQLKDRLICLPLYGTDFFCKCGPMCARMPVVIAARDDQDGSAFEAHEILAECGASGNESSRGGSTKRVHPWFRFLVLPNADDGKVAHNSTPTPSTPLSTPLTQSVPDISSTMMRQAFKTLQQPTTAKTPQDNAAAMACLKQHLHDDVLEYLLQNNFCSGSLVLEKRRQ